jgi:hypothetical protein
VDGSAGVVFAVDGATVATATFNAAWLLSHWLGGDARGRRLAAVTLAALNGGIAVEAAFAQALFTAHRLGLSTWPLFAPAAWIAARALLLVATLLLSALILRRRTQ